MYLCNKFNFIMRDIKIIHVHLIGKRKDYYFGSMAAVYSILSPEDIGCTYNYLKRAGLARNGYLITKKAIIKQSFLISNPHKNKL